MSDKTQHNVQLGITARWIAGLRAIENNHATPLFTDHWAAKLAGTDGEEFARNAGPFGITMLLRTRYYDDFLQQATGEKGIRQVVLLAPGLDTRAFRFTWPPRTTLFELDQPQVFNYKEPILKEALAQATCERHILPVDLTGAWDELLLQNGFKPTQPSVWIMEGFLFYLSNEAVTGILETIGKLSAPGSGIGFDMVNTATYNSPLTRPWIEKMAKAGVPWLSAMDNPTEYLRQWGWKASVKSPGDEGANFGRWPFPVAFNANPDAPHNWFVTAFKE